MAKEENDKIIRRYNRQKEQMFRNNGIRGRTWTFRYILNNEDLIDSFLEGKEDLGYPLRKEVKRDRYVVNKKALKKAIEKGTEKVMKDFEVRIHNYVNHEIIPYLEGETTDMLNSITCDGNTFTSHKKEPKDWVYRLGAELGKAIVESVFSILDDTFQN